MFRGYSSNFRNYEKSGFVRLDLGIGFDFGRGSGHGAGFCAGSGDRKITGFS